MKKPSGRWRVVWGVVLVAVAIATVARFGPAGSAVPSSPPELVVQGFVRALAEHRFDAALPHLSEHMLAQTIAETLAVRIDELERRTGRLSEVRAVPEWAVGSRAYAVAEAETEKSGHLKLGFGLVREPNGAWRIDELYDLGWKPVGLQD